MDRGYGRWSTMRHSPLELFKSIRLSCKQTNKHLLSLGVHMCQIMTALLMFVYPAVLMKPSHQQQSFPIVFLWTPMGWGPILTSTRVDEEEEEEVRKDRRSKHRCSKVVQEYRSICRGSFHSKYNRHG